jgi:uncharacterized delta-60 repeat protein
MPLRYRFYQPIFCLALLASTSFLCAQTTWTAVNSPTTQDLWGVCYGGGQFVAVGTGGTILTSPGGNNWTQRSSGVDLWLVGVCYGNNTYVAVGDRGTILTSRDGITWLPRASGTLQRLNRVAFVPLPDNGTRFAAVGEGGTVCTSLDSTVWTTFNIGMSSSLHGVSGAISSVLTLSGVYVGGQRGTLFNSLDGRSFAPVNFPASSDIGDVAVSSGFNILAVGADGLIATGPAAALNWNVQRVGTSFYRGALNTLMSPFFSQSIQVAVGSGGVIATPIQRNSSVWMPIQLPKSADLFTVATNDLDTEIVAAGQGGIIWSSTGSYILGGVNLVSPSGPIYSGSDATLQVANTGVAAISYQWQFNGVPIAGATQQTLALHNIQPSQSGPYFCTVNSATASMTVSTQLTVQLAPPSLGLVDLSFDAHLSATPTAMLPLPDGRLLVSAPQAFTAAGQAQYGLARLNSDGSVDPTFRAGDVLSLYGSINQILLQPDGKVVIRGAPGATIDGNTGPRLARLNRDGSLDATFSPDPRNYYMTAPLVLLTDGRFLLFAIAAKGVTVQRLTATGALDATYPLTTIPITLSNSYGVSANLVYSMDASGRVLVAASSVIGPYNNSSEARLARLQPDGTLDGTFALSIWPHRGIGQLEAVQNKIYYVMSANTGSSLSPSGSTYLGRLNADGSFDPTYPEKAYDSPSFNASEPLAETLLSDGSIVIALTNPNRLLRYDANGQLDRNFSAYCDSAVNGLTPLPDGRLLALVNSTSINGVPRDHLARLIPDTHYAATRLTSLSVRANAGSGDQTLIVGLAVNGSGQKTMLLRGVGPSLAAFGVSSTLADPQLTLFNGSTVVLTNDNWSDGAAGPGVAGLTALLQDFPMAPGSKDAATVATPGGGLYTMPITGHGSTGVALAEAYDADPAPADFTAARVGSFSARALAGAADQTLTAGFAVSGSNSKRLLIRAVGPGLTAFGLSGVLADPVLTLYQCNTVIATNDDWNADTGLGSALQTAAQQIGAFALPADYDAALLVTLPPGVYTAQVSGKNGATGIALIEIYEAP